MTLTRRDAYATLLLAVGILLALSVIQGWSWPLMNGVRTGIIALGVTGMLSCSISGWAEGQPSLKSPFMIIGALLGVVALGVGLIGLFADSMVYLVVMMTAIVALWLVTVVHRLLGGPTASRPIPTA
jgi:hypothetical protein